MLSVLSRERVHTRSNYVSSFEYIDVIDLLSWQRRMTVLLEEDALPASLRLTHLVDLAWAMHQLLNCCHTMSHFPTRLRKPRAIEDYTRPILPSYKSLNRYVSIKHEAMAMHQLVVILWFSCAPEGSWQQLVRAPIELKLRLRAVTFHFFSFRLEYRAILHTKSEHASRSVAIYLKDALL